MKLHKHTLNLTEGDVERLRELYPGQPVARTIRQIIQAFIAKRSAELAPRERIDVDVSV